MVDRISPAQRSRIMASIRGRDTKPERAVRSLLHAMGYRFRLHGNLPGRPDIVLARYRTVIFVHGCFWHRHWNCRYATVPATNARFWRLKFDRNVQRDRRATAQLRRDGWRVVTVWTCRLRNPDRVAARLDRLLAAGRLLGRSPGPFARRAAQSPPSRRPVAAQSPPIH